jgi:hypothetical protein
MSHIPIMDGGCGLQVRRKTANVLHKQLWKADSRWPFNLVTKRGPTNLYTKETSILRNVTRGLGLTDPCEQSNKHSGKILTTSATIKHFKWHSVP